MLFNKLEIWFNKTLTEHTRYAIQKIIKLENEPSTPDSKFNAISVIPGHFSLFSTISLYLFPLPEMLNKWPH